MILQSPVRMIHMQHAGLLCIAMGLRLRSHWWLQLSACFLLAFLTYRIIAAVMIAGLTRRFAAA